MPGEIGGPRTEILDAMPCQEEVDSMNKHNPNNRGGDADLKIAAASWIAVLRPWDVFATLTFVLRKFDATRPFGIATIRRRFFDWTSTGQRILGRPIEGVGVVESHRSGEPHIHALLEMGGVTDGELVILEQMWAERWAGRRWSGHGRRTTSPSTS